MSEAQQIRKLNNEEDTAVVVIKPVPLPEISTEFTNDVRQIRTEYLKNIQVPVVYESQFLIDTTKKQIDTLSLVSDNLFERKMQNQFFQSLDRRWIRLLNEIENVKKTVISYTTTLEETKTALSNKKKKWIATAAQPFEEEILTDINKRINSVYSIIDSVQYILNDSLRSSLKLQNKISDINLIVLSYQEKLEAVNKFRLVNMFTDPGPALWEIKFEKDTSEQILDKNVLLEFEKEDAKWFLNLFWDKFIIFIVIFLFLLWGIMRIRKAYPLIPRNIEKLQIYTVYLFKHPVAFSAILTVFCIIIWFPRNIPLLINRGLALLIIIQVLYVFHSIVIKQIRWSLYFFFIVYLFYTYFTLVQHNELYIRIYLTVETTVLLGFFSWFVLNRKKMELTDSPVRIWYKFLIRIGTVFFFGTVLSSIANILGFTELSQTLNFGVLSSFILALILGTAYVCIKVLINSLLYMPFIDMSLIFRENKALLKKVLNTGIGIVTVVYWLYITLRNFLLWDTLRDIGIKVWNLGYQFGTLSVTVGSIIGFFLIVFISWVISNIIRNLLQFEVLGRFELPRGVPLAVGSITHYTLMMIAIILALYFVGIDLKNLSLLIGALGVGIGFGLQDTVNNFVSGLILAFERPVTVGDIVEVGEHSGRVLKIGIRSSIIRKWDGSRLIIPNSDLISSKVLNWTMAKYERRITLTLKTHLDTEPDLVLSLLREAVNGSDYVLTYPEAKAYFLGVKDKYLEFELMYWISGDVLVCRSEVNLAVQKILKKAGIRFELPLPIIIEESRIEDKNTNNAEPGDL